MQVLKVGLAYHHRPEYIHVIGKKVGIVSGANEAQDGVVVLTRQFIHVRHEVLSGNVFATEFAGSNAWPVGSAGGRRSPASVPMAPMAAVAVGVAVAVLVPPSTAVAAVAAVGAVMPARGARWVRIQQTGKPGFQRLNGLANRGFQGFLVVEFLEPNEWNDDAVHLNDLKNTVCVYISVFLGLSEYFSMPSPEYIHHLYPTETFLEALEHLYEDAFISKSILVCLNDDTVKEYAVVLGEKNHTVIPAFHARALEVFRETPNTILLVSLERLNRFSLRALVSAGWNAFMAVDVPSYHLDAVFKNIMELHRNGVGVGDDGEIHLLWFLH